MRARRQYVAIATLAVAAASASVRADPGVALVVAGGAAPLWGSEEPLLRDGYVSGRAGVAVAGWPAVEVGGVVDLSTIATSALGVLRLHVGDGVRVGVQLSVGPAWLHAARVRGDHVEVGGFVSVPRNTCASAERSRRRSSATAARGRATDRAAR